MLPVTAEFFSSSPFHHAAVASPTRCTATRDASSRTTFLLLLSSVHLSPSSFFLLTSAESNLLSNARFHTILRFLTFRPLKFRNCVARQFFLFNCGAYSAPNSGRKFFRFDLLSDSPSASSLEPFRKKTGTSVGRPRAEARGYVS